MSAVPRREVAIIGMACVFPGARNMQRYWENILHKVDAVSDPPPDWEADFFYDPDSDANDRTYCKRGGYLGKLAEFNPMEYGIMPNAVDGTEPDHFLALRIASEALADAGYSSARMKDLRERTEVILGRGTYVNRGNTTAVQHSVVVDSVLRVLKQLHPEHTDAELDAVRSELKSSLPPFHADTAPGLVPNIISGRVANRLDLMGANYIVDAACASSLIAVDLAINDLLSGRCDMAIAGGTHASTPPTILVIFSQLKALSRKGQIRPFDSDADGTLLGEGVGMVVLKRLTDAEHDGDRIYAIIKGVGTASDGRALGLLAPRIEGEELALRRAYEAAGVDPATVELIEAHGTATPVGDVTEVDALKRVIGPRQGDIPRCALGSVKSMISHTMPASGSAGLIKAALALHHKVLPPTLHCENPNPKLQLETSAMYLNSETRPWIHGSRETPRRAGVNAFGFGGINAHVVVEEYTGPNAAAGMQYDWDSELFVLSGATRAELLAEAQRILTFTSSANEELALKDLAWTLNCSKPLADSRLAIVAASLPDLAGKLGLAIERLKNERTSRIRTVDGIYYFQRQLASEGKLAFVFPGEGAQYENMLADLCIHFPEVREVFDLMDRAFEHHPRGYLPSDTIFPLPKHGADRLWSMDAGAEAVFVANQAMYALVDELGIRADAMVGHSTGEHSALLAGRVVLAEDEKELIRHIRGVNQVFEDLKTKHDIPQGILMAVAGADHAMLESLVAAGRGQLHIALDNCPHQVVLCGTETAIDNCMRQLSGKAAVCQKLPFARAYHTPWFEVFSQPLRRYFDSAKIGKSAVALYSCVTGNRYPEDPDEIREVTSIGWARTVRFRETISKMYQDGARIFVEVGPRGNLTGFIDDILRGQPYIAIPANVQHRSGILQMQHMLAQLAAHGVPVNLQYLYKRRAPVSTEQSKPARKAAMVLSTALKPVRLPENYALPKKRTADVASPEPATPQQTEPGREVAGTVTVPAHPSVLDEHFRTMQQFLAVQNQVMSAYLANRKGVQASPVPAPGPFITEISDLKPGIKAVARHRFSLERELLFRDHTLGRDVSRDDISLSGLPVVPLTIMMEILAEGGALLEPGKVLAAMRDFRAYRWITLDQPDVTIEITAERREPGSVHVTLREGGLQDRRPLWAEATMQFSGAYPAAPAARPRAPQQEHPSRWAPERLYVDGMFHGPSFQAVKSIDHTGSKGNAATLEVLPRNTLFADTTQPGFLLDPVVLDAAGQVVAFWSQEQLDANGDIFPYRFALLECFAPPQAPGERVNCRVMVTHVSGKEIHSDIEITDARGQTLYRLQNWEDRRFPQQKSFWQLRIAPREAYLSTPWAEATHALVDQDQIACCRLSGFPQEFFEASHAIWPKVLAHLTLTRREREHWQSMRAVDKRRHDWLLGRCAAKDAVRLLIKKRLGVQLAPAEIEIVPDAFGRPQIEGAWMRRLRIQPVVSISHCSGTAVALAAADETRMVGIDIESLSQERGEFQSVAFTQHERDLIAALAHELRHEWSLRIWCAKEALSKALGRGLSAGLHALRVSEAEIESGRVQLELYDGLLKEFPQLRGKQMTAHTSRENDLVFSTIVYQKGAVQ